MTRRVACLACAGAAVAATPSPALTPLDETAYAKLIRSFRGHALLVDFWATWCEPCRAELPLLVKMERKLRSSGFRLLTVSADDPEQDGDAAALLRKFDAQRPWYRKQARKDEEFINSVDPKWSGALPALFLYGRDGSKVRTFIGETDAATLEAAILRELGLQKSRARE